MAYSSGSTVADVAKGGKKAFENDLNTDNFYEEILIDTVCVLLNKLLSLYELSTQLHCSFFPL